MVHPFKIRNGVKTCGPCGKIKEKLAPRPASETVPAWIGGCSDARCPWQNEQPASAAELEAKYGHLMLWRF